LHLDERGCGAALARRDDCPRQRGSVMEVAIKDVAKIDAEIAEIAQKFPPRMSTQQRNEFLAKWVSLVENRNRLTANGGA
jgi:acyl-CoA reductase-like NAD-dependent aldehyde dehydrogenase